jgi:hypothetical protein
MIVVQSALVTFFSVCIVMWKKKVIKIGEPQQA